MEIDGPDAREPQTKERGTSVHPLLLGYPTD
jgi:hypothetical protein